MGNNLNNRQPGKSNYISELGVGILLLGIGLLIYNLFPFTQTIIKSFFNVYMLIFILGVIRGVNKNFKGNEWWIIMLIGGFLWLTKLNILNFSISKLFFPAMLVLLGISIIIRRGRGKRRRKTNDEPTPPPTEDYDTPRLPIEDNTYEQSNFRTSSHQHTANSKQNTNSNGYLYNGDYINLEAVLGENTKMVISKNFKGGNASSIMGSCNLILSKADISGTVYIDCFVLMGEINIIVPSDFNVVNNISSVMAGVEDKRNYLTEVDNQKNLVLRGQAIMGSVKIKNF